MTTSTADDDDAWKMNGPQNSVQLKNIYVDMICSVHWEAAPKTVRHRGGEMSEIYMNINSKAIAINLHHTHTRPYGNN